MTYPAWPKTLPLPQLSDYGIEDESVVLRTDMDDGLARQRRKSSARPAAIPVKLKFDTEQHAVFSSFLEYQCEGAANWFRLQLLIPGFGADEQVVRLKPGYKTKANGFNKWLVTATLEIKKQPLINTDLLAFLSEFRYDDLLNAANIAHNYVELRYPLITIQ